MGTFTTLTKPAWQPNVLLIYLDDCKYDVFGPNGGPAFFQSPSINSIAEEGINFRWCFPALSLCQPGRASIISGLYPHHHGVYSNALLNNFPHTTIAEIMHDAGYYTGFVGKYGIQRFPVPGYDFYCHSSTDEYWNARYQDNEEDWTTINGHKTEVFTDRALQFLDSVPPGKKFMLLLAHKAPHVPYDSRTQDEGLFDNDTMPFPENYPAYVENAPSHYTDCNTAYRNSSKISETYRGYFELLNGAEWSIDTILNYLKSKNLLDSTLIIFTS
jgi:N-acetylglucosamine-6-sulfatase